MSYLKTIVAGHLGNDARVSMHNGQSIINFSVAYSEKFKDAQGVQQERTTWINASWFVEKTTIAQYLKKGGLVIVEGTPSVGIYQDKNGKWSAEFKLRVSSLKLLGSKKEENGSSNYSSNQQDEPPF